MMKKALLLSLTLALSLSLIGCSALKKDNDNKKEDETVVETVDKEDDKEDKDDEKPSKDEENTKEDVDVSKDDEKEDVEDESSDDIKLSKAETAANDFATAIMGGDYETALTFLDVDTTFISASDLEWFIPRSDVSGLEEEAGELTNVYSTEGNTEKEVTLTFDTNEYEFATILNDDNEWKVYLAGFYVENWNVSVPGDLQLFVNGKEVTKDYFNEKVERREIYTIPAIAVKNLELKVVSSVYGEGVKEVLPSMNSKDEPEKVSLEITGETRDKIFEDVKTLLNTMNEGYENGETSADFMKYISSKADPALAQTLYDSVHQEYTWNSSLDPTNVRFTTVKPRTDLDSNKNLACFVANGEEVGMNIAFEKTWDEKYNGKGDCRSFGWLYVVFEDGAMKIADISASDNLITERNDFTGDW